MPALLTREVGIIRDHSNETDIKSGRHGADGYLGKASAVGRHGRIERDLHRKISNARSGRTVRLLRSRSQTSSFSVNDPTSGFTSV
jgi:hypothetical protein